MDGSVDGSRVDCKFDHLQFFVDTLKPLEYYKAIELRLNTFAADAPALGKGKRRDAATARKAWCELGPAADPDQFQGHGQDLVEQMLYAFGWRITGSHDGLETRSVLLATVDPKGVRFVVTCKQAVEEGADGQINTKRQKPSSTPAHFAAAHLDRFRAYHNGAQGVAVLGFEVALGDLDQVLERYRRLHPKLLVDGEAHAYQSGGAVRVLDVFAFYAGSKGESAADVGTCIRFVERASNDHADMPLPGLQGLPAAFPPDVLPAYCDHWVSNVRSRVGFLETLQETLGFTPKVDFNAGVVAAGEAQIDSTVMGNTPSIETTDPLVALADRSQVYLPTNNALSPVGHVHWYLEQLGQGIQHVASRVQNLAAYVERANDYRRITGHGFTFLSIPRTYYGLLDVTLLVRGGAEGELLGTAPDASRLGEAEAAEVLGALREHQLCDATGAVDLEADDETLARALRGTNLSTPQRELALRVIGRSRFVNLWKLMREQLGEAQYLKIVRNKILIDVQGEDVLMQIFTSVVLQRTPGTEAPFLEFIERVCAQCQGGSGDDECAAPPVPVRPGCGGFGIRNFLTLFLSIEVSKAMVDANQAGAYGNTAEAAFHSERVALFTSQLVESNPILTDISDCMTAEGKALAAGDTAGAAAWCAKKADANERLQKCSAKFNGLMKALREKQSS